MLNNSKAILTYGLNEKEGKKNKANTVWYGVSCPETVNIYRGTSMENESNFENTFDSNEKPGFLDVRATAKWYGISIASVWRLARTGKIPAPVKLSEMTTRWRLADLEKHAKTIG